MIELEKISVKYTGKCLSNTIDSAYGEVTNKTRKKKKKTREGPALSMSILKYLSLILIHIRVAADIHFFVVPLQWLKSGLMLLVLHSIC